MSPLGREMQKDVPSTKVIVPDPTGPAAVSAFHPAIPASLRNRRPRELTLRVMPLTSLPILESTLRLLAPGRQRSR
jgi:hypothetical protein